MRGFQLYSNDQTLVPCAYKSQPKTAKTQSIEKIIVSATEFGNDSAVVSIFTYRREIQLGILAITNCSSNDQICQKSLR